MDKKEGRGERSKYRNYRRISLMGIPGNICGRILINRVEESTRENVMEEQGRLTSGSGCTDQIFVLKKLVEKCREKKEFYVMFMDLRRRMIVCREFKNI